MEANHKTLFVEALFSQDLTPEKLVFEICSPRLSFRQHYICRKRTVNRDADIITLPIGPCGETTSCQKGSETINQDNKSVPPPPKKGSLAETQKQKTSSTSSFLCQNICNGTTFLRGKNYLKLNSSLMTLSDTSDFATADKNSTKLKCIIRGK